MIDTLFRNQLLNNKKKMISVALPIGRSNHYFSGRLDHGPFHFK
jgi:hypothetical protein